LPFATRTDGAKLRLQPSGVDDGLKTPKLLRRLSQEGYLMLEQGQYGDDLAEGLQQAIGRAQMCAGWLALDSGRHDIARSSFNDVISARNVA
jgi:hypothetical protein